MNERTDYRSQLQAGRWFQGLPEALQTHLLALAQPRQLPPGQRLFARGDAPCGLYCVVEGAIRISAVSENGKEALLILVEAPHWFGEIALFDGQARTHDAYAEGHTQLLQVPQAALLELLRREPHYWRDVALLMSHKLRLAFIALEEMALLPAAQRLARRLLMLAEGYDNSRSRQVLHLPQEQLALMLSLSRQTTNQILKDLEAQGILQLSYGGIEILDLAGLRAATHGWSANHTFERLQARHGRLPCAGHLPSVRISITTTTGSPHAPSRASRCPLSLLPAAGAAGARCPRRPATRPATTAGPGLSRGGQPVVAARRGFPGTARGATGEGPRQPRSGARRRPRGVLLRQGEKTLVARIREGAAYGPREEDLPWRYPQQLSRALRDFLNLVERQVPPPRQASPCRSGSCRCGSSTCPCNTWRAPTWAGWRLPASSPGLSRPGQSVLVPLIDRRIALLVAQSANPAGLKKLENRWEYLSQALRDLNSKSSALVSASGRPWAPIIVDRHARALSESLMRLSAE